MGYVVVTGHSDPTNWTAEVIFERNDDGTVKTAARKGEPVELNAEQVKYLKDNGFTVEDSSKSEAEKYAEGQVQGAARDVAGSAPVLGASSYPAPGESEAENVDQSGSSKSGSKNS